MIMQVLFVIGNCIWTCNRAILRGKIFIQKFDCLQIDQESNFSDGKYHENFELRKKNFFQHVVFIQNGSFAHGIHKTKSGKKLLG